MTYSNPEQLNQMDKRTLEALEYDNMLMHIEKSKKWIQIRRFMRSPKKELSKNPIYALIFSIPIAFVFFIVGFYFIGFASGLDSVVLFTFLIAITPPGYLHYSQRQTIKKIEEYLPNFLRDVAEMNRSGMTLTKSVNTVAKGEYGALTKEIKQIDAMLSWGISFEEALEKFADRNATSLIVRSVSLINQASRAGGNVADVLEVAASDAYSIKLLERERVGTMLIYIVISYMAFFVFLFVIGILSYSLIPVMAEAGASASATGGGAEAFMGAFDPEVFYRLYFHAALIQGIASGLVAGQLGEGEWIGGLKHSVVMALIAWVTFMFII